jgi:hypothetical protein
LQSIDVFSEADDSGSDLTSLAAVKTQATNQVRFRGRSWNRLARAVNAAKYNSTLVRADLLDMRVLAVKELAVFGE